MKIVYSKNAWEDYNSWLSDNKKMLSKINALIKDIQQNAYTGKGKPEPLKYDLLGLWSRRIDQEHRLIYRIEENALLIYACRYHY